MLRMKNILFFTPSLNAGGIERVFLTYAEELHKKGYRVSYLIVRDEQVLCADNNLNVISLKKTRLRNAIPSLINYLRNNQIDVIITGGEIPNAIIVLIVKIFSLKIKTIISHHNYFVGEHNSILSKLITRYCYNLSDTVVSVSFGITQLLQKYKVKAQLIKTIYNPVNIAEINIKGNVNVDVSIPKNYLIFVGRLAQIKNLELLLDAFSIVKKTYPDLSLLIVGDGDMKKLLENHTNELQITDKVHFLGAIPMPYSLIRLSKAVVLSSYSEALPTIVLESLVLGKTVVSTPTNGAVELLENGKYGYLTSSFDDANAFASLIEKALTFPKDSLLLKKKAMEFNVENKVNDLEKLFS